MLPDAGCGFWPYTPASMHPIIRWSLFVFALLALILIPFALVQDSVGGIFATLREGAEAGPWVFGGLVALMLAGDIFLPVPSSIANTAVGSVCGFWWGTAFAFIGLSAGCLLGYFVGAKAGPVTVRKLMGPKEAERLSVLYARYGFWVLIVCRAVPVLAEASVLVAGIGRMALGRFLLAVLPANLGISLAYSYAGAYAKDTVSFLWVFVLAMLIPGLLMLLARLSGKEMAQ